MEIKDAQKDVDTRIKEYGNYWEPLSMFARLAEEVGEVGRAMNIKYGGKKKKHKNDGDELSEEIADVFFTLLAICNALNIDLEKEFISKNNKSHSIYREVYKNKENGSN